ncbi:MAG: tetratricopeptide repeat protein [Acidobacteriota bacterium]
MAIDKNKIKQNVAKFVSLKKYPEAIREQQKLVDDNPKDIPTLQYLGNIYLMAGQKEQAVPIFVRVAELYHKSGFTPKALASIKIALREAPDNTQAQELYATFAEQTGLQRDAIDAYEKLVNSYTVLGQLDKAESILSKLLDLSPENIRYQLQHGDLLTRLNRKEEAIPSYLKAAENLVTQGKIKESAKIYERVLQIDAKKITALENSVKNLLNQKEPQKALELLETVVAGKETPSIISELKADILISMQEYEKAEAILRRIAEKFPIRGALLQRFLRLYLSQKKFEILIRLISSQIPNADALHLKELEGAFEEIISQSPSTLEAFSGLIVVQRKIGDKGRLLSTLSKYSDILLDKGDYKSAETVVKEMLEIAPNEMQLLAKLDDIRDKLGYEKVEPSKQKEPEVVVIEKEKEFQQEIVEKEVPQESEPDVEIEVEIEDISSEMPVVTMEKEKEEKQAEVESLSPEQIEVTSTFTSPPVIQENESDSISIDIESEEEIKETAIEEAGEMAVEEEPEGKEKEEIEEAEVEPQEAPSKEFDERRGAAIQEKFSEAQIFLKYGLVEKAIGELQSVLKIVPDHIQAHQKLIGIYRQLDKKDKLVRQIIKLANVFKQQGDLDTAENLVEEAMQIDPNHKAILEFTEKGKEGETAPKKISGIKELDALAGIVKGKKAEAPKVAEKIVEIEKPEEIAEEIKEEIKEEEKEIEIDMSEEEPSSQPEKLIEVEEQSFEEVTEKEEEKKILEEEKELQKEVEEESFSVEISPEEVEKSSELNEKLEEAEFYFAQELYEDAKRICEELNNNYPEDVRVIDLLGRINVAIEKTKEEMEVQQAIEEEKKEEEQPETKEEEKMDDLSLLDQDLVKDLGGVVPAERKRTRVKVTLRDVLPEEEKQKEEEKPIQESGEEYYDLAKELGAALEGLEDTASGLFDEEGEEKTSEEMSFEEVFKEFKKGVEKKVAEEDYDTHYNLGIAYKEMELIDEAIGEFQIAARSPMFFADACAMLGKCFQIKGMYDLAEKWYRKGLDSRGFPEDVYNGLKYDLAELLEETDRKKEALELYKEVYASNANYREVKDKISSLK